MKKIVLFITLALSASPHCSHAAELTATDVLRAERARIAALVADDHTALGRLLADELIYTHSSAAVDGKASFMEALTSGRLKYKSLDHSGEQVRIYGDAALLTGETKIHSVAMGEDIRVSLRFTILYVRKDGHWQMTAWQSTRIPAPVAKALGATETTNTSRGLAAEFRYSPPNLGTGRLPAPLPPGTRYALVHRGSLDPEVGAFANLPNVASFHGRLIVTWNNHLWDEDQPGQRLQMRQSTDEGRTWFPAPDSPPTLLSPALGRMQRRGEKRDGLPRVQWNSGFAAVHDRLWAIANVGPNHAKGDLLALEVRPTGTRGDVLWLTADAPAVEEEFPHYPTLRDPRYAGAGRQILSVIDDQTARAALPHDSRRPRGDNANAPSLLDPGRPGSPADGQRLIEPTPSYHLKDGTLVRFWRDYGNALRKHWVWRVYVSFSRDQGATWSVPERTSIPSNSTRVSVGTLPDGRVYLLHNPYTHGDDFWQGPDQELLKTASPVENMGAGFGGSRKVLTLSLSEDGKNFTRAWTVRTLETPPRIAGHSKRHYDVANPAATLVGDTLYIVYSLNKEDIELCAVYLPDLGRKE